MNDLGTALRDAAVAADPERADAGELWQRGRRRIWRRRLTGAVSVAALVLGVALVGNQVPVPTEVMPVAPTHEPAIPKNIYQPSRWIEGTDDAGPPGQLAVLGQLPLGEEETAYFGISATTGEYRMLDLPGRVDSTEVTLSTDGRKLAYWFGGKSRKSLFAPEQGASREERRVVNPIGGFAVYDTDTGRVVRHRVPSDHGIRSDGEFGGAGLLWVDETSLIVSYGLAAFSGMYPAQRFLWTPGEGEPHPLGRDDDLVELLALPDRTLLASRYSDNAFVFDEVTRGLEPTGRSLTLPGGNIIDFSRRGARVVATGYVGDGGIQRVLTGVADDAGRVRTLTPVGQIAIAELLGWRGDSRVLVAARPAVRSTESSFGWEVAREDEFSTEWKPFGLYDVDLDTGKVTHLGTAEDLGQQIQVATDLLAGPMVQGAEPPLGLDPRILWGGFGALVLGSLLIWWRRRRVRP